MKAWKVNLQQQRLLLQLLLCCFDLQTGPHRTPETNDILDDWEIQEEEYIYMDIMAFPCMLDNSVHDEAIVCIEGQTQLEECSEQREGQESTSSSGGGGSNGCSIPSSSSGRSSCSCCPAFHVTSVGEAPLVPNAFVLSLPKVLVPKESTMPELMSSSMRLPSSLSAVQMPGSMRRRVNDRI